MAFDPVAGRARDLWVRSAEAFDLFFSAENRTVPVKAPRGARVGNPVWSPDGSKLAFFAYFPDATHIYVADTETGDVAARSPTTPVLATLVTTFQWSKDGKRIQTVLLPDDGKRLGAEGRRSRPSPKVRVARDGKNPSRTYRYLLESPYDMQTAGTPPHRSARGHRRGAMGTVTKVGAPGHDPQSSAPHRARSSSASPR